MENYSYHSYADSGESSPRSRDVDFDNLPPPWEDPPATNKHKVKFMCSYGGKIHPRPHDNQLSYVGGETKILSLDRSVKFAAVKAKLMAICEAEVCFKYQLPGEDLDALISFTNDDDLEHMMLEYDRLNRANSSSPARLRLFLFPVSSQSPALTPVHRFGSTEEKSERERFMDAFNSGRLQTPTPPSELPPAGNMELTIGSEKGIPSQPSEMASRTRDHHIADSKILSQRHEIGVLDEPDRIQKHIDDLQRLHIAEDQQSDLFRRPNDGNLATGYHGDYYIPKMNDKTSPTTLQVNITAPANGYQMSGGLPAPSILSDQQHVYMIQAPASIYQAPMARPVTGPINHSHGYYVQSIPLPSEVYREQPVYNINPQQSQEQIRPQKMATYTEGYRMVQSTTAMAGQGYVQMVHSQQPLQPAAQHYQAMGVPATMALGQESAGKVVHAIANIKELI